MKTISARRARTAWRTLLCLAASLTLVATAAAQTVVRGPYLQLGTDSEITVRWRTDVATDSAVSFGNAPGNLNDSVTDATATTEHSIQLTGLTGNTTYYYSVGTTTSGRSPSLSVSAGASSRRPAKTRSRITSISESARTSISASGSLPLAVSTRTTATPSARCTGFWTRSRFWIRE